MANAAVTAYNWGLGPSPQWDPVAQPMVRGKAP